MNDPTVPVVPFAEDPGSGVGPETGPDRPGRRRLLRGALAVAGAAALSPLAAATPAAAEPAGSAASASSAASAAAVVVRRFGRYEVLALLDAHGPFPGTAQAAFPDATATDWERARRLDPAAFGPGDTWELDFRCYAVRRPGGRVTLVDTGIGPVGSPASGWAPVPGRLPAVLARVGIDTADVETVVLTHLHEDHYGWSVTPEGVPVFPNARYVVQHAEVAALGPTRTARTYVVEPLLRAGQLHEVDGHTVLGGRARPGGGAITLLPTPGHTPGHQSVLVDGGGDRLLLTGDVLVHAVQLASPGVRYLFEADPEAARHSREQLLGEARRTGAVLGTAHLNRPFVRPWTPAGHTPPH
ncbi:MBL fold metallo-hydrolase [Kitasatospora purpeofusca]|uniref:MBL fold metallo-hydrolase n=1 Tax=Kitasatospora purpeofusca TaxID=67352 RepID=UPI00224D194F|nr:MBL fold metallo-hydrolase [Kitasatospora purpeofusca]MCX4684249.1 MBL fold metallo-hydrolase [Kitasatospora purpeofusca]